MKLISWNVNGIRAVAKKDFFSIYDELEEAFILNTVMGSDHCPVGISLVT